MFGSTAYHIAHGSFAKDGGIVVEIRNSGKNLLLFRADYWSDFTEERECLFIGGLQPFAFVSIHDNALQQDYRVFIEPLTAFTTLIRGWPFTVRPLNKKDSKALDLLISDRLSPTGSTLKLPPLSLSPPTLRQHHAQYPIRGDQHVSHELEGQRDTVRLHSVAETLHERAGQLR